MVAGNGIRSRDLIADGTYDNRMFTSGLGRSISVAKDAVHRVKETPPPIITITTTIIISLINIITDSSFQGEDNIIMFLDLNCHVTLRRRNNSWIVYVTMGLASRRSAPPPGRPQSPESPQ